MDVIEYLNSMFGTLPAALAQGQQPQQDPAQQYFQRNSQWVIPGTHMYNTPLSATQERDFREWVRKNNIPFDPDEKTPDYDMRGFYTALQKKDPRAVHAEGGRDYLLALREAYPWAAGVDISILDKTLTGDPTGAGNKLEYYPADAANNPRKGKTTIEIYDKTINSRDLIGELISHYLPYTDPNIRNFRRQVISSMTPAQINDIYGDYRRDAAQNNIDKGDSFAEWLEKQGGDSFFRGYLTNQWPQDEYTEQQKAIFNQMTEYLNKNPYGSNGQIPEIHFPDYWKTPYHETFSNESQWALPTAPRWNDKNQLVNQAGAVLFDDKKRSTK